MCFYCTQSDILLCGIARFSRGNKNKLRTFQSQKGKKIKNSQPQTKVTGSYTKKRVEEFDFTELILSKIFYLVPFSCVNCLLNAKYKAEKLIAK